jgi:D-glycero-alpha-D-manno-heptose-7-phosphate kinase
LLDLGEAWKGDRPDATHRRSIEERSVLITRTPLRISIGGGGTDLPSYYRHAESARVISAAINKYIYIGINATFVDDYFVKYSALERVDTVDEIKHPLVREAIRINGLRPGVEIVSMADIPAGTGLGSSGSFTVGLLRAIHAFQRKHVSTHELAEEACRIEIDLLGQPVGKQDQYIAAFGGITCFDFKADESVDVAPLAISADTLNDLQHHLLLFFTGYARSASEILSDQKSRSESGDAAMVDALRETSALGQQIGDALVTGDTAGFADLMHEHWERKRRRSSGMSNSAIDDWYELGRANGGRGGKLVGAGAGGFLMFYADDPQQLRRAMADAGLREVSFQFDFDGSTVTARG